MSSDPSAANPTAFLRASRRRRTPHQEGAERPAFDLPLRRPRKFPVAPSLILIGTLGCVAGFRLPAHAESTVSAHPVPAYLDPSMTPATPANPGGSTAIPAPHEPNIGPATAVPGEPAAVPPAAVNGLGAPGAHGGKGTALPGGVEDPQTAAVGAQDDEEGGDEGTSSEEDVEGNWIGEAQSAHKPRPLVVPEHKKVDQALKYFLTRRRAILEQGYRRSGRFLAMIRKIFAEEGIPAELAYLAAVESNYNPNARSRARAAGLWQFMRGTARKYGLRVNLPWYDERLDPVYSSRAAARLLADLHDTFGNWELAIAAYNAGEGRVIRAIRRARQPEGEENFWTLRRLPRETKGYVPSFFALAKIYADPAKYELAELEQEEPIAIDAVKIEQPTTLEELARRLGMSREDLAQLNPAWRRGVMPPARFEPVLLHVPEGQAQVLTASLATEPLPPVNWREHIVSRGDTLSSIAHMYRVPLRELAQMNPGVRRLSIGQSVQLPVPQGQAPWPVADDERPMRRPRAAVALAAKVGNAPAGTVYRVQPGDTLWSISQAHGVTVRQLKHWNDLRGSRLKPDWDLIVQNPERH